jgi:hypothetical protein
MLFPHARERILPHGFRCENLTQADVEAVEAHMREDRCRQEAGGEPHPLQKRT